jgi:hypothetical protein
MSQTPRGFQGRSTYIDGLRGLAALAVACYHIDRYGPLPVAAMPVIPRWLMAIIDHGSIGVQVFFVISGFVIAYSVRSAWVTPRYLGNYVLRRSIRLDPPYWTTILFVLLLHAVMHLHLGFDSPLDVPSKLEPALSWHLIASHVLYLQNILAYFQSLLGYTQYENLSAGFWTLCIEVQFYLLYVVGQGIAQRFPYRDRRDPAQASPAGLLVVFAPLALLSLFVWNRTAHGHAVYDNDMWIIRFFSMFFLGASAWWVLDGRSDDLTIGLSAAFVTGLSVYVAGWLGKLGTWLNYRPVQYLGAVSYSLYLIHFPMSHVVTTMGSSLLGDSPSPAAATAVLVLALAVSLLAAHILYVFVEAPSVRLAARFKRPNPAASASPIAPPVPVKQGELIN